MEIKEHFNFNLYKVEINAKGKKPNILHFPIIGQIQGYFVIFKGYPVNK